MGGGTKFLKNHQGERGGERENANGCDGMFLF